MRSILQYILVLILIIPGKSVVAQEAYEIKGTILDSRNRQPLPSASVTHDKSYLGIASNLDGEFHFYLPSEFRGDSIKISYVGYKPQYLVVRGENTRTHMIFLEPMEILLGEVIVKSKRITGNQIISRAISRIEYNYFRQPYILKGFYRELTYENSREVEVSEASIEVYKTGYQSTVGAEQVKVIKSRKVTPNSTARRSTFNFEGGTYFRNSDDLIKNRASFLRSDHLPYYSYTISRVLGVGDESIIVLSFEPNDNYINAREAKVLGPRPLFNSSSLLYSGEIYIKESDYSIIKVEYWLNNDRLRNTEGVYLTQLPKGVTSRLNWVNFSAEYRMVDGKYVLSYTNGALEFTVRGGPFLVSTDYEVFNEFLILDMNVDSVKRFDVSTISDSDDNIKVVESTYDQDYWKDFNIILASNRLRRMGTNASEDLLAADNIKRFLVDKWLSSYNELIHLHIDRTRYISGETIFFKAYVVEEATGLPSNQSNSFYALLLADDGEVVDSARFKLEEGMGVGSFDLPQEIPNGLLTVVAYSSNMQNYNSQYAFVQSVIVESAISFKEQINKSQPGLAPNNSDRRRKETLIQFLPEGGELLTGVRNSVGVVTVSPEGDPVRSVVVIKSDSRRVIDTVYTDAFGLGEFSFTPSLNRSYLGYEVIDKRSVGSGFELPKAVEGGLTLKLIENREDTLRIRVSSNKGIRQNALLAFTKGNEVLGAQAFEIESAAIIELFYQSGSGGVGTLTLFDGETPVAERLVSINTGNRVNAILDTEYSAYPAGSKAGVGIRITDRYDNPLKASLSLAVVDSLNGFSGSVAVRNILYTLWLKTSLKSEVPPGLAEFIAERVGSYSSEDIGLIDRFLLCYGWRRISLDLSKSSVSESKAESYSDFDVIVTRLIPKVKKRNLKTFGDISLHDLVNLESTDLRPGDDQRSLYRIPSGSMESSLMIGFNNKKDIRNWEIESLPLFNDLYYREVTKFRQHEGIMYYKDPVADTSFKYDKDVIQIDEVKVTASSGREKRSPTIEDNYNFSNATTSYKGTPEEHPAAKDLISLISQILSPRRIDRDNFVGEVYYREVIKNPMMLNSKIIPAIFILNDMPISTNYHDFDYLQVSDIESVRVVLGANAFTFWGEQAQGGAILIYTKRDIGNISIQPISDPGFIIMDPLCRVSREFYKPLYSEESAASPSLYRLTLHWEPDIVTDKNGEAVVEYLNPDYNSDVLGILQGVTEEGIPIFAKLRYRVIKE